MLEVIRFVISGDPKQKKSEEIMKKSAVINSIIASAVVIFASACASTPSESPSSVPSQEETAQTKTSTGPRKLNVVNSSASQKHEETPEALYAKKIEGITLSVESMPKETTAKKAFASPFVFKAARQDGSPVEGLELSVSYPETKINGTVSFGLAALTTNASGTVTFIPATPSYAFDSVVSAYISGDVTNEKIAELASKSSVSAAYKVKTDKMNAGGTISLLDFNSAGKPVTNNSVSSSNLLMALMRSGFKRVGNADFAQAILSEDRETVYKAAKSLLGAASAYLVYGTVKYASPVEKTSDGRYTLTIDSKVTCLDMKNGSVLMETEETVTVTEDKDWNCIQSARKELAERLAEKITYGL